MNHLYCCSTPHAHWPSNNVKTRSQTAGWKTVIQIAANKSSINDDVLTVRRLDELSVLTQYLFHNISSNRRSRDDLKYDTSSA